MPATSARPRRLSGLAVNLALLVNLGPATDAVVASARPKSAWTVWAVTGKNR